MRIEELGAKEEVTFEDCKLDRKKYAEALTEIISGFENGGVIALNNKWGTGKTTFVKMWKHYLEENQYQTIYFNAWENDFEDNPLAAFISELKEELKDGADIDKVIKLGSKLMLKLGGVTLRSLADKYLGKGYSSEVLKAFQEESEKILSKEIEQYNDKKNTIKEFRKSLANFVSDQAQNSDKKTNIIFFVDELDRCRPNYAVKLLEIIKHLFTVPNIIFVLSIDKEQLGYAIQGVYGSSKIDSDEYLRRFIDIEYNLPDPDKVSFLYTLFDAYIYNSKYEKLKIYFLDKHKDISDLFFTDYTLREVEKNVSYLSVITRSVNHDFSDDDLNLLQFLLFIKNKHTDFYNSLREKELSPDDILKKIYSIYKKLESESMYLDTISSIEAYLLLSYERYLEKPRGRWKSDLYIDQGHRLLLNFESEFQKTNFEEVMTYYVKRNHSRSLKILFDYIELIPK